EGGMITTNDAELAEKTRRFNSLGYGAVNAGKAKITKAEIQDPNYERHVSIGWNYRMPELCAAVLLAQVERLEELIAARVECASFYSATLKGCDWLTPQAVPANFAHSYWTYALRLEPNSGINWRDFRNKYIELGGDGIYGAWKLTYLEPVFRSKRL